MVRGLKALHDLKICHRDIKCANIFLTREGVVKLGDLNVSKVAKGGLLRTQTGTPYYACPEVWKDMPYDYRGDICVLLIKNGNSLFPINHHSQIVQIVFNKFSSQSVQESPLP